MKAWWTLSVPQTSRANPVQCCSTHTHVSMFMHINIHIVCTWIWHLHVITIHICIYIYVYLCTYICVCILMFTYTYIYIYIHIHIVHIYIWCKYMCTYIYLMYVRQPQVFHPHPPPSLRLQSYLNWALLKNYDSHAYSPNAPVPPASLPVTHTHGTIQ